MYTIYKFHTTITRVYLVTKGHQHHSLSLITLKRINKMNKPIGCVRWLDQKRKVPLNGAPMVEGERTNVSKEYCTSQSSNTNNTIITVIIIVTWVLMVIIVVTVKITAVVAINMIVDEKIRRSVVIFVASSWEETSREQPILLLLGAKPVYCLYLFLYWHLSTILFFANHSQKESSLQI